jgi:shikimate kinase
MSIVLVGYRGSGKSTIGKRLADRLGKPFVDVDDLIVGKARKSIREVFAQDGEPFFRDLETEAMKEISLLPDHVIGLGGGSLGREENRRVIRDARHAVIYLKCEPIELHRRIRSDPQSSLTRPNLTSLGGGIEEIQQMLAAREPLYQDLMTTEIDVTRLTPDEAVASIIQLL